MKKIDCNDSTVGLRKLIEDITVQCINHNYKISFTPDSVDPNDPLGGFVDSELRNVNIVTGYNGWVTTLPHEASHLDQIFEKSPLWMNKLLRSYSIFAPKKHPNKKTSEAVYYATAKLEIDCDTRAVKKIVDYDLKLLIDLNDYIQTANVYHASHMYFHKYKCFYHPKFNPSLVDSIRELFPNDRVLQFHESWVSRPLLEEYIKKHHTPY